jgi:S-adenosylmethionine:tRNA ribosyltransferase-isomerase
MQLTDFDYTLPPERIAQTPVEPRDMARLLLLDRRSGQTAHARFFELGRWLRPGDTLVLNDTKVLPARLFAQKPSGGKVEILLLRAETDLAWEALVGGKRVLLGQELRILGAPVPLTAIVTAELGKSRRRLCFSQPIASLLNQIGQLPLPPYIHSAPNDPNRYQSVYAKTLGSAAAPTAGLHFTPQLLASLQAQGVEIAHVTLHVGLDTFQPIAVNNIAEHQMHSEWCELSAQTADQLNQTRRRGGRIVAVGTTSVRTLETAAQAVGGGMLQPFLGDTRLFITPGTPFHMVDLLITNFHLPKSTLLLLVSAFCQPSGREKLLAAYQTAISAEYRFFSFGDAMLIGDLSLIA